MDMIDWFFEKELNGNLTREAVDVLRTIGASKMIDGVLEIGSNIGLSGLVLKDAIGRRFKHDIVEFDADRKQNAQAIFMRANYLAPIFLAAEKDLPKLPWQYDLILVDGSLADLDKVCSQLLDQKPFVMDAFVVLVGVAELPACFKDSKAAKFEAVVRLNTINAWIVKY